MNRKLIIAIGGAILILFFVNRPTIPQPNNPGKAAFYSFERHIERFLDGWQPFKFSDPATDPKTGWIQYPSNQWELHGFLLTTNAAIPWLAIIHDKTGGWGVDFIKVGSQILKKP